MAMIRLGNVINRWGDGSFFAYNGPLPPADTIDDIHRRIRDKGTFDKNDLNGIVSHYTTIDPKGIRENADNINRLYRKLDDIGEFKDIVPQPNSDLLDDFEWQFQKEEDGHEGTEWYVPGITYGSATNYETRDAGSLEGYISVNRFDNEGFGRPEDTGYEIEFVDDHEYPTITFSDVPKTP